MLELIISILLSLNIQSISLNSNSISQTGVSNSIVAVPDVDPIN